MDPHTSGRLSCAAALAMEPPGRWLLLDSSGGQLIATFQKERGEKLLGLASGRYTLVSENDGRTLGTEVQVPDGGEAVVTSSMLVPIDVQDFTAKGGGPHRTLELSGLSATGALRSVWPLWGVALVIARQRLLVGSTIIPPGYILGLDRHTFPPASSIGS